MTEDISPDEWQGPGCKCDYEEYACGGDCCGSTMYTCSMHKARGMDGWDIYEAWLMRDRGDSDA